MVTYCSDCLKKYFTNSDEIIFQEVYRDWDGADEYGPKAFLYDFLVIYKKNNDYLDIICDKDICNASGYIDSHHFIEDLSLRILVNNIFLKGNQNNYKK